jgi:hypothetical protein
MMKLSNYLKKRKLTLKVVKLRHLDLGGDGACDLISSITPHGIKHLQHEGTTYVEDNKWDTECLMSDLVTDIESVEDCVKNLSHFLDQLDLRDFQSDEGSVFTLTQPINGRSDDVYTRTYTI